MNYKHRLIHDSLQHILHESDTFTEYFIEHLKEEIPRLESSLNTMDTEKFQFDLLGNITVLVANLDNILMLESHLHEIAYQLLQYNITADDLPQIINAFTKTLHTVSNASWDNHVYHEWDTILKGMLQTLRIGLSHFETTKFVDGDI